MPLMVPASEFIAADEAILGAKDLRNVFWI